MQRVLFSILISTGLMTAAVIDSNTVAFSVNGTENDHFTQFDPTLGTLTGVTLFYTNATVTIEPGVMESTTQSPASLFADFENGADLTLPGVATIAPFLSITETHFGCTSNSGEFTSCSNDQLFTIHPPDGSIALVPSPDFSAYIGLSTVLSQLISENDITNITSSNLAAASEGIQNALTSGNYFLEYAYTAAESGTPEPVSAVLIGTGLIAVGLLSRSRPGSDRGKRR